MKKCNYCNAEMPEDASLCPNCGREQGKRLSTGKTVFAVAALVAFAILLAAFVLNGNSPIAANDNLVAMSEEATEPETVDMEAAAAEMEVTEIEETTPPTIPADGNPDDVTCKGTYTADNETVLASLDTVIATSGDDELTVGQFQVFYWMEVRNFLSQYGAYAAYFGLDYQQPLDTQICSAMETPVTWQQYFVESALNAWASYTAMAAEADAQGYTITESQAETLAGVAEDLAETAKQYGFESGDEMLQKSLGAAANVDSYRNFMELYYKANGYYNFLSQQIRPTDEELEAFFEEHAEGYAQSGVTKDSIYVDVRHVLLYPEGADGTNLNTEEFPEEAWTASEAAAQALLDAWMEGDRTEESFAAMANEHSQDPGSNKNGGLYTNVTEGEMVQAFNDWCFDSERKVGDTGIVKTNYGYHIMYFSGARPIWVEYAESDYIGEHANAKVVEIEAKRNLNVKYDAIVLALTELN